jgi:hypothetical protein
MTAIEYAVKLGETGVPEATVSLLGIDLALPELKQSYSQGRAKGIARMLEQLYQIASGEKSEGSLAATKLFLANTTDWREEILAPPEWAPSLADIREYLERLGVFDGEEARQQQARDHHVCWTCGRPWEEFVIPESDLN